MKKRKNRVFYFLVTILSLCIIASGCVLLSLFLPSGTTESPLAVERQPTVSAEELTQNIAPLPTATPDLVPTEPPVPTATLTETPAPTVTLSPTDTPTLAVQQNQPDSTLSEAQVTNIVDGDTIDVLINGTQYRVRYILMDTPEMSGEPLAVEATEANRQLVEGKTVLLEKDVSETDRYGRLLRYVYVDGLMVNEELLRRGLATVATYPPDVKYVDRFRQVQAEAQAAGIGLWAALSIPEPTPTQRQAVATENPPPATGTGQVVISSIFYDGIVKRVESDEYAEITNIGSAPVDLGGWRLNADDPGQDFIFPAFVLQPGQSCRVYTNEIHSEFCGFSFGSGKAIWSNKGECGHLYDASKTEVSTKCF